MDSNVPAMANGLRPRGTVLVTGGAGYIGTVLVPRLLAAGYRVRVLDRLLYGDEGLRGLRFHPHFEFRKGDFRSAEEVANAAFGVDAVVHLGAIVGDAACDLDPELSVSTNVHATRVVADACRSAGIPRMVFISTCSVYGASEESLDENSALNPVSLYARTKIAAEQLLLERQSATFAPVILRLGTAFGFSPRPRFDLVVNLLTAQALAEGRVSIYGGSQWRPFVHLDDISQAIELALAAPIEQVAGEIFNVGGNENNLQLGELGEIIREEIPGVEVNTLDQAVDRRNYYVRFDKIHSTLGFLPTANVRHGVSTIKSAIQAGQVNHYRETPYHNHLALNARPVESPGSVGLLPPASPSFGVLVQR